jgi:peptide/nickel transport system permease protein
MSMREKEFVEAGRALGFSKTRIIFKHILPNVIGPVIVISAANFAAAILIEAGLSFLGIGAQPPTPSWGYMINAHRGYILGDSPYLAFIPGVAIMLMVLAFVLIGNGLKDALDTKFVDDDNPIV